MAVGFGRLLWFVAAALFLLLPQLSIPAWVSAPDPGPDWKPNLDAWVIGSLVVLVIAALGGRVATRWRPPVSRLRIPTAWFVAGIALAVTVSAAAVMQGVFAGNAHLVDEMAQLFQARAFAVGRIAVPAGADIKHFLLTHSWVTPAGWASQYPPLHSAMLGAGIALGAAWLLNPLVAGISAVLVYLLARGWYGPKTARISAFLWFGSAWVMVTSGTYMNHVTAAGFALGAWALLWGWRHESSWGGGRGVWRALGAGACFAALAAIRPLDAVAAAAPVAWWLVAERRWKVAVLMVLGGVPGLAWLGWYNTSLFGGPLSFGYTALYGEGHGLGFHVDAWGVDYTPAIALANMTSAMRRLHLYLFEWPIPALLPLGLWAVLARPRRPTDRLLVLATVSVPILYFFYWHSGFFVGPRLYYVAAPGLVIGTARAFRWLRARAARFGRGVIDGRAAVTVGAVAVVLWGWLGVLPARLESYRDGLPSFKLHPERELADRGVERALVLVPVSWGARVIVNLWALGVTPGATERAYRVLDTCDLHEFVRSVRGSAVSGPEVERQLDQLMLAQGEPAPLVTDWPDPTLRLNPRDSIPAVCAREAQRDLDGFTTYANLGWRNVATFDRGIVFARDLFEDNLPLLERYAGWDVWRYAPPPGRPSERPVLTRLSTGSASGPPGAGGSE